MSEFRVQIQINGGRLDAIWVFAGRYDGNATKQSGIQRIHAWSKERGGDGIECAKDTEKMARGGTNEQIRDSGNANDNRKKGCQETNT
jgi:hypothetical protein